MSSYLEVKKELRKLFGKHFSYQTSITLGTPRIVKFFTTDRCDVTSIHQIRVRPVRGITSKWHAAHLFGHYLCDAHEFARRKKRYNMCDYIADVIAKSLCPEEIKWIR